MDPAPSRVREDFDRIARLTTPEADRGTRYDAFLLRHLPGGRVLDVGCGTGVLTRKLSARATHVTGLDLSSEMIRRARAGSSGLSNVTYVEGDLLTADLPPASFDGIVTAATLHHLPLEPALTRLRALLTPGGVLVVHDLLASNGWADRALDFVRFPVSVALRFVQTGQLRSSRALRAAWAEHGRGEQYMTAREVHAMCDRYLPGGRVHLHLLWRYTIVWQAPR
ncbi:MAG TPA: class I SAM-dependent methyltransferase [Rubricoccaceae bacterium]|nr:class I SAM-dependent methyltransferase [Rubricoccaceae bacterium]